MDDNCITKVQTTLQGSRGGISEIIRYNGSYQREK